MGFVLQKKLKSLPKGAYKVVVDTELYKGQLTADYVLKGEKKDEIMFILFMSPIYGK